MGVRAGGGGSGQPRFFVRPQTPGRWWGTTVPGTIFDREGARVRGWCECTALGRGSVGGSDRRKRVLTAHCHASAGAGPSEGGPLGITASRHSTAPVMPLYSSFSQRFEQSSALPHRWGKAVLHWSAVMVHNGALRRTPSTGTGASLRGTALSDTRAPGVP